MKIKQDVIFPHTHKGADGEAEPIENHGPRHGKGGPDEVNDISAESITCDILDGNCLPAISTSKKGGVPAVTPSGKFLHDSDSFLELISLGNPPAAPYAGQLWCDPAICNPGVIVPIYPYPGSGIDVFCVSMLHFNGADTSTVFTDEIGKVWTPNGDAQLTTTDPKFGSACGIFDGTGDYIDTPDHDDFYFGTGNFTIDFWINSHLSEGRMICGQRNSAGQVNSDLSWQIQRYLNAISFYYWTGTTGALITGTTNIFNDNWHHVAIVRNGMSLKLYIDGTSEASTTLAAGFSFSDSSKKLAIGRVGEYAGLYYAGKLDEFRISKGIARWTENFAVPIVEYANV